MRTDEAQRRKRRRGRMTSLFPSNFLLSGAGIVGTRRPHGCKRLQQGASVYNFLQTAEPNSLATLNFKRMRENYGKRLLCGSVGVLSRLCPFALLRLVSGQLGGTKYQLPLERCATLYTPVHVADRIIIVFWTNVIAGICQISKIWLIC
jgi:hypothetical protein